MPQPQIARADEVKIQIAYIGICTSDLHVLHKAMTMPDGNIVGHEYSGVIVEMGSDVRDLKVGDRVVCELAVGACGRCRMCRRGKYEFCPEKRPPGWASPGVYAEYAVMASQLSAQLPAGGASGCGRSGRTGGDLRLRMPGAGQGPAR